MALSNRAPSSTRLLAIILPSYLMLVLDVSVVITALPKIQHALHFSATGLSWVQNAYTLAFGGLLLLGARAGDILGRRRMFIIGIAIFTGASLAAGLAQSAAWLLTARSLQGVGAAIAAPSTLALLMASFPEGPERTRAIAYYGAVAGGGGSVGLVLGGVLTDWLSWRWGLFINVPVGIAVIVAASRSLPETQRRSGRFDLAGAATSTLGMTATVYGIVRAATAGWTDRITVASLLAGAALIAVFVLNERRAEQPVTPLRLFANRERAGAYGARILFVGAMFGTFFFLTQFLQRVKRLQPAGGGPRVPAADGRDVRDGARRAEAGGAVRKRAPARGRRHRRARRHDVAQPDLGRRAVPHGDRDPDGDPRRRRGRCVHAADRLGHGGGRGGGCRRRVRARQRRAPARRLARARSAGDDLRRRDAQAAGTHAHLGLAADRTVSPTRSPRRSPQAR